MRRRIAPVLLVWGLVAGALSGCALPGEPLETTGSWSHYGTAGENAVLVLGAPDSDDVQVMLSCRPRSGAVEISLSGREGDGAIVELHSGKIWNRYGGAGHIDEELGGYLIDLKLAARDPVLQRFADTGQLAIRYNSRVEVLPNAFAPAHDFLAECRAPSARQKPMDKMAIG